MSVDRAIEARVLVTALLGPGGSLGDGSTWRCGLMADELHRLLRYGGIESRVRRGKCNGIDHCWVEVNGVVIDPARGQFGNYLEYSADPS